MASSTQVAPELALEYVHSPLRVIHKLYDEHASENNGSCVSNFGKLAQEHFQTVFANSNALQHIPVYDQAKVPNELKSGSLVRFRCMVQDPSYGEELHLTIARVLNSETGETQQKFSQFTDMEHTLADGWEVDYGSVHNVFTEKEVAYCVSIPGQSAWTQLDQKDNLESAMEAMSLTGTGEESKRTGLSVKYPISGAAHSAALVKFYAPNTAPKVSSAIDVIGIYELGRNAKAQDSGNEDELWPCIHAIYYSEVRPQALHSMLPELQINDYASRHNMCLAHLTSVLGGDDLAAQYLLLHLLSKTVRVQDAKVGKLSLNLIGIPTSDQEQSSKAGFTLINPASKWISDAISQLVPYNISIPFDLKLLNKSSFLPNAEDGDLQAGTLQLVQGTEVLCDETCLSNGTLEERGVRNLHAVQTAIIDQQVTYLYPFQPIEMPTNLRFLVLSTGKSILHNDCDVYLSNSAKQFFKNMQSSSPVEHQLRPLDPMHTEQLRQYLECARHMEFSIPQPVSDFISNEYAQTRRAAHEEGKKMMTQEELALTITVARLISISKGESELSLASWNEAVELERCRKERNLQTKSSSS
ncbi:hypothetical protein IWW36_001127 [Coemansia brasiliensis]|uniref:Mini-chromosome maintenance complex-binding protein n=1 Tax=Coemansia brasiliensis TaxID=2650707 RepID=A0A9W8I9M5_9FUNG|nr:hypothetical protein IWW36_001127 [Coemansia brasiliensis]